MEQNPYESPAVNDALPQRVASPVAATSDKWESRFAITFAVYGFAFITFAMLICGCHFSILALPSTLIPIGWSAFVILSGRTIRERLVGYANVVAMLAWFALTWLNNTQFLF